MHDQRIRVTEARVIECLRDRSDRPESESRPQRYGRSIRRDDEVEDHRSIAVAASDLHRVLAHGTAEPSPAPATGHEVRSVRHVGPASGLVRTQQKAAYRLPIEGRQVRRPRSREPVTQNLVSGGIGAKDIRGAVIEELAAQVPHHIAGLFADGSHQNETASLRRRVLSSRGAILRERPVRVGRGPGASYLGCTMRLRESIPAGAA